LAAGEAGSRIALPNARVMVHQPSGGYRGVASDIVRHAEEIQDLKTRLNNIYVKHTGQDYEAIERKLDRDTFMTAEDARDFGIIDQVYERRTEVED
jgi:ATP-dependent Clp protease protease subunit